MKNDDDLTSLPRYIARNEPDYPRTTPGTRLLVRFGEFGLFLLLAGPFVWIALAFGGCVSVFLLWLMAACGLLALALMLARGTDRDRR